MKKTYITPANTQYDVQAVNIIAESNTLSLDPTDKAQSGVEVEGRIHSTPSSIWDQEW